MCFIQRQILEDEISRRQQAIRSGSKRRSEELRFVRLLDVFLVHISS